MNCDYERFRSDLERMDHFIECSYLDAMAVDFALENLGTQASERERHNRREFAPVALRMEVLRHLLGLPSFRSLSRSLACSDLLADFCRIRDLMGIRWSSKSTLERASKIFTAKQFGQMNVLFGEASGNQDHCLELGLQSKIDVSICLMDSTCLQGNLHYPTDWVLLRDVSITLLKATQLIRKCGLLERMPEPPKVLSRKMNRLCIEMTHCRSVKDARRKRKKVLRNLKKLLKKIGEHAHQHRLKLLKSWNETDLSEAERDQILSRMDEKLMLLPKVIHQAHERIIGARRIASKEKILSAHDPDIHVIVRGKAGRNVEFGNELFLAETPDGVIIDYKLYKDTAPSESKKLIESIDRQQAFDLEDSIAQTVGDRGFDSKASVRRLKKHEIENHICPKNIHQLRERMKDESFSSNQCRRSGTEARIAILKNNGGRRVRAKGFEHREIHIGCAVLAHNLWLIARKIRDQKTRKTEPRVQKRYSNHPFRRKNERKPNQQSIL